MLATWKLAPALAAGARSCQAGPRHAAQRARLAQLAAEVGIPGGVVNVVPGDGPTTGTKLVSHPDVDKVAFTGSTETGREIMRLASDLLKRVSLELGGKSPNLVFADADIDDAIPSSVWSIYYLGWAKLRSALARARREAAVRRVRLPLRRGGKEPEGGGSSRRGDTGGLRSRALTVTRCTASSDGPRRRRRGRYRRRGAGRKRLLLSPTVLANVENRMVVAQEEIFGPVVTVIPFEDEKDAVRIANDVKYGLFATVWTGDPARGHRPPSDQGRDDRRQHGRTPPSRGSCSADTNSPGSAVSSVRDARPLPRDEVGPRLDEPEALQPVGALARGFALPRSGGGRRERRRGCAGGGGDERRGDPWPGQDSGEPTTAVLECEPAGGDHLESRGRELFAEEDALQPVPGDVACTQIYGGDEEARTRARCAATRSTPCSAVPTGARSTAGTDWRPFSRSVSASARARSRRREGRGR